MNFRGRVSITNIVNCNIGVVISKITKQDSDKIRLQMWNHKYTHGDS